MLIIACPGQGSQTPGFLSPWLEIPSFANLIGELSDSIGLDIAMHGTTSDADTIRNTEIAQPLIVAASIASAMQLDGHFAGLAGHSVGEVAAAALSGIISADEAIKLIKVRGEAMAQAASLVPGAMAAVLGGDQAVVLERLRELDLYPANFNGGGQIVAAGKSESIAELVAAGPAGSRVIQLQVAGAFHTRSMQPAVDTLSQYAAGISVSEPNVRIWSNQAGQEIFTGQEYLDLVVGQVANPVRWDLTMQSMSEAGATALIELAPAGALTGLAKRSMPGVELLALKSPEQLDAANELIKNHA
jgi:[acyl-carrier-protein] S-malonyltransferase